MPHSHLSLSSRGQSGVALVIVLAFLVLLSVLIISFYSSVNTELVASKNYAGAISTRQLSETATNFVMGQISDSTAGFTDPGNTASPILSWASQPGMIRTYGDNGLPYRYYKLYSARNMVVTPPSNFNVNTEFTADTPTDWWQNPAVFTDLNAPIKIAVPDPASPATKKVDVFDYPIVDPLAQKTAASSNDGIDGFEILKGGAYSPPGFKGSSTRPSPTDNPISSPNANPAMMPTRWLYVLRDGTFTAAPDAATAGATLSWSGVADAASRPTKANPIVGRIAFWTDDETAKININTASEGTFWDRPWGPSGAAAENSFASYIPAQSEVQRYAGHPAMTCLSPVLGFVMPWTSYPNPLSASEKRNYYWLVPRIQDGGTHAGTNVSTGKQGQDNERLFASVDELAFAPAFTGGTRNTWTTNSVSAIPAARARDALSKAKFFLTASARAPDVNLFNKPRVCLWPLQFDEAKARNANDRYIAFCSTTGTKAIGTGESTYYFQRYNTYATTAGQDDGVKNFVNPMPSSCHPTMDWDLIPRNGQLYAYLQKLTDQKIPGFGASLVDKYDLELRKIFSAVPYSDRDQIMTEMVDYIRTEVNTYSTSSNLTPQYDYAPTRRGVPVAGETQLVPLKIKSQTTGGTTMGFGRFATVTEVAVVFQRYKNPSGQHFLRAHVVLQPFNPSPGCASWSPEVRYIIKGLENFKVSGVAFAGNQVDLGFPKPTGTTYPFNWTTARVGYVSGGHKLAFMGLTTAFRYFQSNPDPPKVYGTTGKLNEYPFFTVIGAPIPPGTPPNAKFSIAQDVPLEIEIYSGYEPWVAGQKPRADLLVQTLHPKFPAYDGIPLPNEDTTEFNTRLASGGAADVVKSTDTVRSVAIRPDGPAAGDLRYVSALADVPAEMFVPTSKYKTAAFLAHTLRSAGFASPGYDSTRNPILVPGASYNDTPIAAAGVTAALNVSGQGDFDNSAGSFADGAYINKADEGNLSTGSDSYFSSGSFNVEDGRTFSPNREIASAVSFGSLPTGVKSTEFAIRNGVASLARPWQTLLFTANPSSRLSPPNFSSSTSKHPGFGTTVGGNTNQPPYRVVPDHLWLDLFTMPVIEPYAISEPFSTAGRVNLNYQIAPFTYLKRTTGLQGVLRSVQIAAIPTTSSDKSAIGRYRINAAVGNSDGSKLDGTIQGTLYGFQQKFDGGDIFRSASQICDMPLIPVSGTYNATNIDSFWAANQRTGDNVREIPYGHIYPRVTTKSNTFTIHMRVQALHKAPSGGVDEWNEKTDSIVGEYRGSTTIERYIDASETTLPDFAKNGVADNLDRHYRFRVIGTKAFVR